MVEWLPYHCAAKNEAQKKKGNISAALSLCFSNVLDAAFHSVIGSIQISHCHLHRCGWLTRAKAALLTVAVQVGFQPALE